MFWLSNALRYQVPNKVYHQRANQLRQVRFALLHAAVGAKGLNDWLEPEPSRPGNGCGRRSRRALRFGGIVPALDTRWSCSQCSKVAGGNFGVLAKVPRVSVREVCRAPGAGTSPGAGGGDHGGRGRCGLICPGCEEIVRVKEALWGKYVELACVSGAFLTPFRTRGRYAERLDSLLVDRSGS